MNKLKQIFCKLNGGHNYKLMVYATILEVEAASTYIECSTCGHIIHCKVEIILQPFDGHNCRCAQISKRMLEL